jgi:ATP/maltotriose-dependent transcriptional regulator MalT
VVRGISMSGEAAIPSARQRLVSPLFAGRATELAELRSAAERVRSGTSARVLITGEAGIGKSRLTAEFVGGVGADWLTVSGGCPELGAEFLPYVAFLPIVQQLVEAEGGSSPGAALSALLPQGGTTTDESPGTRLALLHQLLALIERAAARRPLLLVVEDLHWADSASRELFGYLARNLGERQVMLVGTVRTGELPAGHPIRQLVAELGRREDVMSLPLTPLDAHHVGEQVTAIDGRYDPARAAAIYERSGGNPLFVEALAGNDGASESAGPLSELLLERIARLSDSARYVLGVASIAGGAVGHDFLARLADRTNLDLDLALRELVERDQLLAFGEGYRFRHDLIREAVDGDLLPGERQRLHARAAELLSERPDLAAQGRSAAELAEHWYQAGRADEAYAASLAAADEARAVFAFGEELRHLQRALDLRPLDHPQRLELLERAVDAAMPAGQAAAGFEHANAALELIDAAADPERAVAVLLKRSHFRSRLDLGGRPDLDRALQLLPTGQPSFLLGSLHYLLAVDNTTARSSEAALDHAAKLFDIAEELNDDRLRCRAYTAKGYALMVRGDIDDAVVWQKRAQDLAVATGEDYILIANCLWFVVSLMHGGHWEQLIENAHAALRQAELLGMERWRGPLLRLNIAFAHEALGRTGEAIRICEEALAAEPEQLYRRVVRASLAGFHISRGDVERALPLMPDLEEVYLGAPAMRSYAMGYSTKVWCELALVRQLPESANHEVDLLLRHTRDLPPQTTPDLYGLLPAARLQRARLAAAPRNRVVAAQVAANRAEIAALISTIPAGSPTYEAQRRAIETELAPDRLADWDGLADTWRRLNVLPEVVESLIGGAEAALASSNRAGARRRLAEARHLATQADGTVLLRRIDALAQRAGLEPQTSAAVEDATGLTRREHDVLRLLARGLPNRQIASELFISPATVGVHVSRVLGKLGASSRTEAAAMARTAGLLPDGE